MYDMLKQYSNSFHSDFQAMMDANGDELRTKQYRSKVTENKYDTIRNSLVEDIISKYHEFDYLSLNSNNKIVFLFHGSDAFICKTLGHFIYEGSFYIKK